MSIVYFDASALVKLVIHEDGTDLAEKLWNRCDAAISSRLAYAEVVAAIAAANRNRDLSNPQRDLALAMFDDFWDAVRAVELTERVQMEAGRVAKDHALRGADAIHLASALIAGDPTLIMAAWDRRLSAGATAAGLLVSPALD